MPAPSQESPDDLMRLTEALEHMPDSQRRAILLREWQGLSYHEIADELTLSQSAVETLIFRARRTLASNLESEPERPSTMSRTRKALDAGALLAMLKGLFERGAAVKVAAVAVAASGTVVVATAPLSPLSKPAAPQEQAVTSVAQAAPAAQVVFERTHSKLSAPSGVEANPTARSALPTESSLAVEAAAAAAAQAPPKTAPAAAAAQPKTQKPKDESKATPQGQAKKQQPAAQANGDAGKEKRKKAEGKSAPVDPPSALAPAAPTPEELAVPVELHATGSDREDKDKGPKK